jgi:MFS family permease
VAACFYITAFGHVALAVTMTLIDIPPTAAREEHSTIFGDLLSGFRWVLRSEAVFALMLLALVPNLLIGPLQALMPIFARDVLGGGASTLGWMLAASGFGAVFGSMAVAMMSRRERKGRVSLASAVVSGLVVAAFAASDSLALSLFLLVIMGVSGAVYGTMTNALVQTLTPREYQGRVVSTYMLTWNLIPVGALALGALADGVGTQTAVAAGGLAAAVGVLILAVLHPVLRRI